MHEIDKESEMLRLAITDPEGKLIAAKDVPTAAELLSLADQARAVIRECENLAHQRKNAGSKASSGQVPYSS